MKSTLFGQLADIFANNTVISPRQAKHASVCLLPPHKRPAHSFALTHKQRQTSPLFLQTSLVLLLLFSPPSLSEPRKGALTRSPRNKLEVFGPHTEQCEDLSLTLFLFLPPHRSHSPCFTWSPRLSLSTFPLFSVQPGRIQVLGPLLRRASISTSSAPLFV